MINSDKLGGGYDGVRRLFRRYWDVYGGWIAVLTSPYAHTAAALALLLLPTWWGTEWWHVVLNVTPSILGFTLAGFTIWLGFGDEGFKARVTRKPKHGGASPYMKVSAGFVHFILLQFGAIFFALVSEVAVAAKNQFSPFALIAWPVQIIGIFLFAYSLTSALAAAMGVFRTSHWAEAEFREREKRSKTVAGSEVPTDSNEKL